MRITAACVLLFAAASAFANPGGRLTVLIPINPGIVPGVGGSQWQTVLWASNSGGSDVIFDCSPLNASPTICPLILKAHTMGPFPIPYAELPHQGFFAGPITSLIGQVVTPDQVSFSLRTTDMTTAATSNGIEIPLPRPSDFHNATITLAQIPLSSQFRTRIRLYGLENGTATVRVVDQSGAELFSAPVALTGVDTAPLQPNNSAIQAIRWPSYGEIAIPDGLFASAARVEIVPTQLLRVWGFASVTNNATQQFTVVAPSTFEYVPISLL
jgi:hypothetical protein